MFTSVLSNFHFLQPLWLLALLPLVLLLWLIARPGYGADSAWSRICDADLLRYLLSGTRTATHRLPLALLAVGGLIAVLALADPVWDKQPQPVFRNLDARVIVFDLSRSMLTPDLPPSRLARARFKVADILKRSEEGQTALVAFAGDAFVVAPLTGDADTINAQLAALDPGIMPVQGSRADLGLQKAGELLLQGGQTQGDILLIADEVEGAQDLAAARALHAQGYDVSVLAVATDQGAPLPDGRGGTVKDSSGRVVMPQLDSAAMDALAQAGGGRFARISVDDSDLDTVLSGPARGLGSQTGETGLSTEKWHERGPWLVLLLLPLAALAFRRGWLLMLALVVMPVLISAPQPAMALSWDDLWLRPEQQAAQALQQGDPERARALAQEPLRKGTAEYRSGHYEQALSAFQANQTPAADADYNRANALARLGHLEEAIAAYDQALQQQPDMEDAQFNKQLVEQLLQQQQEQEKQQQQAQSEKQQQAQGKQNGQDQQPGQGEQDQQAQQGRQADQDQQDQDKQPQDNQSRQAQAEQGGQDQPQTDGAQPAAADSKQPADSPASPPAQPAPATATAVDEPDSSNDDSGDEHAVATAGDFNAEEKQAVEQWLRRIPDDPGGLLRRKFLYQYQQRGAPPSGNPGKDW